MKHLLTTIFAAFALFSASAQTELTSQEAKNLYKSVTKKSVSVHDPSVVYDPNTQRYYIFGSHKSGGYTTDFQNWTWAAPTWTPSSNQAAFITPEVKKVKKGGAEVAMPSFNAMEWSARTDAGYNVDGNMWAPDVIWNEKMQKWCMYLSINGEAWHSSIILLTSNSIQGPYKYQAPVVICGFQDNGHSYKDTDLELAIGTQTSLPPRYSVGNRWGQRWPHTIDPAVFYDEDGKLWMCYGSWSGGIWMLELDEETGLRDYDVVYPSTNGSSDGVTSDPYFGTKIAGGYYVSGEGAYIEHIGNYYYLFVSYGGLTQNGGYEMRVFRSEKPDGPYTDPGNRNAIFTSYTLNFGPKATARGAKLIGPYSHWGFMPQGERSQGHNSIIAAPDGRTYLVYHTRFCNDDKKADEGHQVRVHQVFQNKNGWLVAAPFEYNGELTTDADIASTQPFTQEEMVGSYSVLIHKFANDHEALEQVEPVKMTLHADGSVSGDLKGTWTLEQGTGYISLVLGNMRYEGVVLDKTMDYRNLHATAITALSVAGVGFWAYKLHPKYELAWQLNNQKIPVTQNQSFSRDADLYGMAYGAENISLTWKSSNPDVISDYGKYNPYAIEEDTPVTLTARLETPGWYWEQAYDVKALCAENAKPIGDWQTGMVAHYGFDDEALANSVDASQSAQLLRNATTPLPILEDGDPLRIGRVAHLAFGANGKESYVCMPNPLYGETLADGATLSFWVKRTDNNLWDALFGFVNGDKRLYMTGNTYTGFNDNAGTWIDINHPSMRETSNINPGTWHLVTVVFQRQASSLSGGITVYVDGISVKNDVFAGSVGGSKEVKARADFDYNVIVDHLAACKEMCLGKGSFWGSPDVAFDDVMVYNRPLPIADVMALRQMASRVYDFSNMNTQGIDNTILSTLSTNTKVYDLQGRQINNPQPKRGLYIVNGKIVVCSK